MRNLSCTPALLRAMSLTFLVKRHEASAKNPTRSCVTSVAMDVYSCENQFIAGNSNRCVATGISIAMPEGHFGRLTDCLGFWQMFGIRVAREIITSDENEVLTVLLINTREIPFRVKKGDRIARVVFEKSPSDLLIADVDDLMEEEKEQQDDHLPILAESTTDS
ncbi:Deoxyuridine 5'-triphosphate nucleotidohydrolase [Halotydeus destructor]|nr:Deoxyuridine 5'-triphosphate nucleotidohydrolase [Halotydeus destructor]